VDDDVEETTDREAEDKGQRQQAGIDVPEAVMTRDGQDYVPVTIPATGEQRFAGLASWTEGRLLSDVLAETADQKRVEESFKQLGAITAAMHNQASAWQPPPGFRRHALDSDGLMGMAPSISSRATRLVWAISLSVVARPPRVGSRKTCTPGRAKSARLCTPAGLPIGVITTR